MDSNNTTNQPELLSEAADPVLNLPAPQPTHKLLYILATIVLITIIAATFLGYTKRQPQSVTMANPEPSPINLSVRQKIGNFVKSVVGIAYTSASPSASPVPSPINSSIDEIISTGEYSSRPVDYYANFGPMLDSTNIQIKIPGQQSQLIRSVLAADMQALYPIYLQNPDLSELDKIATTLGITTSATFPENQLKYKVKYTGENIKLEYDPSSRDKLRFEAKPVDGDLPTLDSAKDIASKTLTSIGIPLDGLTIFAAESGIASEFENFATIHQVISVTFRRMRNDYPVVMSDTDMYQENASLASPEITVAIGGNNQIVRLSSLNYGQKLSTTPIVMNSRTLNTAVADLREFGGHIRNIQEVSYSPEYFACVSGSCSVHDATIDTAQIGYYWNTDLPAFSYSEVNDTNQHSFEYLVPVWIFQGTGTMDKSKTDEMGKLLPNPDLNNPEEFIQVKVKFVATIPAFTETNAANLLSLRTFDFTKIDNPMAKIGFTTKYNFPSGSLAMAEPRNGIRYKLLILFPDKTYSVINGYKQEIYPGEIIFNIGQQKGTITTYLELTDFSSLIEKRTLQIE